MNIARDDPFAPDVRCLLDRHLQVMRAASPPESVHAMPADALAAPGTAFFSLREAGEVQAIGAIKQIGPDHWEIKSMHVRHEARGRGLSRRMLEHLIAEARAAGAGRLSLETGPQPAFAPARGLYRRAGFAECPPFGDYGPDPCSVFMTMMLD